MNPEFQTPQKQQNQQHNFQNMEPGSPKQQLQNNNTNQAQKQEQHTQTQKTIKHRVIMTELGLNLIKEAQEEQFKMNTIKERKKQAILNKKKQNIDESSIYMGQLLAENNQKPSETITEKVALATRAFSQNQNEKNRRKNIQSMESLFEKNISNDMKKPYINKQINKFSKQILDPNFKLTGSNNQNSTILMQSKINNNNSMGNSFMNEYTRQAPSIIEDQQAIDKYNQILYAESKIDHIHRRYQAFEKKHNDLIKNISNKYKIQSQQKGDTTQRKMVLMEELTPEHRDLVENLYRQTLYQKRKETRNIEYMKRNFVESWNKFKLPKLTQKSVKSHQRFEKYQDRPIQ